MGDFEIAQAKHIGFSDGESLQQKFDEGTIGATVDISGLVEKEDGKGLSTNDLTNTLKSNYDIAYSRSHTHSNKNILDNFSEESNTLLYKGTPIGKTINEEIEISETYNEKTEIFNFKNIVKSRGANLVGSQFTIQNLDLSKPCYVYFQLNNVELQSVELEARDIQIYNTGINLDTSICVKGNIKSKLNIIY